MNTVLFMLDKWNGENLYKTTMYEVPHKGDFVDIYGKGYVVTSRMYHVELSCWVLIVTKN